LTVLLTPAGAAEAVRGTNAVVIDVLRATSVIATALAAGAAGIIPVATPEDAIGVARRLGRDRVLLSGERESRLIEGFDLDNSPAAYSADVVGGKTIVFATTNGSRALAGIVGALSVRTSALVDRAAVALSLNESEGDVTVVCAGLRGSFAFEDAVGAGALVDALVPLGTWDLSDGAIAAALLFRKVQYRLAEALASAEHGRRLAEIGFADDLERCAALDQLPVAPIMRDGVLVDGAATSSA
jgi:2-phosphosulfolactate phosphatase